MKSPDAVNSDEGGANPIEPAGPNGSNRVLLDIHELRAGYGHVPILHGVSLRVHDGEALGIVGHNGMGKTTLLKAIVGLLPSTGGRIEMDGVDVTREAAHLRSRRGLAYVPQGRGILPGLSTRDNLRLAWTGDSQETESEAVDRCVALFPRLVPLRLRDAPEGRSHPPHRLRRERRRRHLGETDPGSRRI